MGASRTTTITRSDLGPAREYPVNLGSHDEIVLMQSLDLLGRQRDRGIPPTKADIRMMVTPSTPGAPAFDRANA